MNLLLLAAGYGTRLYPLTRNRAKPLLEVAGKPMIERIIELFADVDDIAEIITVTNHRFAADFEAWAASYAPPRGVPIRVIDDGTTSDDDKLGAIGDIRFSLERIGRENDLVVVGGDNLFDRSLGFFCEEGRRRGALVGVYDVGDLELVRQYNHIVIDEDDRVIEFAEKPEEPKSTLTAICLYYFPAGTLHLVDQYLREGNNPDAPGYYLQWLHRRIPVYACRIPGTWFDIGTMESFQRANEAFGGR